MMPTDKVLGAVLAGGKASRFGSDKALALLGGRALIDWTIDALAPQVDAILVCGRAHRDHRWVADRPGPELGPLAGIAAALTHARAAGFARVVTVPCDAPLLPADLVAQLGEGCAYVADMPVIGVWPSALATALDAHLARDPRRSIRGWAQVAGAVPVRLRVPLANVNTPADLAGLRRD